MMRWPFLRDLALFLGGMAGVVHETLLTKAERPTLLIMFAAMMGLPAFLQPGQHGKNEHVDSPKRRRKLPPKDEE